jgi:hypothetical protein
MALDSTHGLPSFSEMYSAYKNKGGLADVINAGFSGYERGSELARKNKETQAEAELKSAQAKEALSKANKDPMADYMDIRSLASGLSKPQYDALAATAIPLGDKLMVKRSEVSSTVIPLVREQGVDRRAELARAEEATARAKAEEKQANLLKALSDRQERALKAGDIRQEKQQALSTAGDVIKEAEKRAPISKVTDYLFNTERQQQIKQAQKIRQDALKSLQPGETAMLNPKTGEIVAVSADEIQSALDQGFQHISQ